MANFLTYAGYIVTAAIGWMGEFVEAITASGNELLLLFTLLPIVGLGVGILKRLINVN